MPVVVQGFPVGPRAGISQSPVKENLSLNRPAGPLARRSGANAKRLQRLLGMAPTVGADASIVIWPKTQRFQSNRLFEFVGRGVHLSGLQERSTQSAMLPSGARWELRGLLREVARILRESKCIRQHFLLAVKNRAGADGRLGFFQNLQSRFAGLPDFFLCSQP